MTELMDRPLQRSRWRRPRVMVAGAIGGSAALAGVLAVALAAGAHASLRVPAASLTIDTAALGQFHDNVALRATVAPKDVVYLDSLEGGQVEEVLVQAGDTVAAGQPLVRFRNTELELEVLDREGRLAESITQIQGYEKSLQDSRVANERAVAQIDYDITRLGRDAARTDALAAKGYEPRQKFDAVHDELEHNRRLLPLQVQVNAEEEALRRRQLPQIQAELSNLQESLKVARSKLDSLVLRAPVAGKLSDMHLQRGEIVNRGQRLGEVTAGSGFKIQARVDEYYQGRVRIDQTGSVEVDGQAFPLRVTRVDPQVKDATFLVELAFTGAQPKDVLPGQALEGRLVLGSDRQGLILPAGPYLERSGGDWVMVVDGAGGHADKRRIRIGRRTTEQVEVLSGLRPGEHVVTSDYTGFDKIDRVVITH